MSEKWHGSATLNFKVSVLFQRPCLHKELRDVLALYIVKDVLVSMLPKLHHQCTPPIDQKIALHQLGLTENRGYDLKEKINIQL